MILSYGDMSILLVSILDVSLLVVHPLKHVTLHWYLLPLLLNDQPVWPCIMLSPTSNTLFCAILKEKKGEIVRDTLFIGRQKEGETFCDTGSWVFGVYLFYLLVCLVIGWFCF